MRDLVKNQVLVGVPAEDATRALSPAPSPIKQTPQSVHQRVSVRERNIRLARTSAWHREGADCDLNQLRKAGEVR